MGISYSIFPFQQRAALVNWLWECWNIEVEPDLAAGRNPSLSDILAVLEELAGYKIEFSIGQNSRNFLITKDTERGLEEWASLEIHNLNEALAEDQAVSNYYFERGSPKLVLNIAVELARRCGPQVVMYNAVKPVLVTPDLPIEAGLKAWSVKIK